MNQLDAYGPAQVAIKGLEGTSEAAQADLAIDLVLAWEVRQG